MKDEIKEKLYNIKSYINQYEEEGGILSLTFDDWKLLLDYITNLQEENRQTKLLKERYQLEKEDYKSRNEKAIDKIQYIIDYGFDYDGFNTVKSLKGLIDMLVDYARQSKDILQGSDKE